MDIACLPFCQKGGSAAAERYRESKATRLFTRFPVPAALMIDDLSILGDFPK